MVTYSSRASAGMRLSQEELSCRVVDATRATPRAPQTMIQLLDCLGTHGALI